MLNNVRRNMPVLWSITQPRDIPGWWVGFGYFVSGEAAQSFLVLLFFKKVAVEG